MPYIYSERALIGLSLLKIQQVFLMLSCQIIDKTIHKHITMFFAKQQFKWDSFFSEITHSFVIQLPNLATL